MKFEAGSLLKTCVYMYFKTCLLNWSIHKLYVDQKFSISKVNNLIKKNMKVHASIADTSVILLYIDHLGGPPGHVYVH